MKSIYLDLDRSYLDDRDIVKKKTLKGVYKIERLIFLRTDGQIYHLSSYI